MDDALLRVVRELEAFIDGRRSYYTGGLCLEVTAGVDCNIVQLVRDASVSWEHFSGDPAYPVPGGELAYMTHCYGTKYKGEQGEYRRSLAAHILTYIWFNPVSAAELLY